MFDRTTITQDNSINFPEEINIIHKYPTTSEQIDTLREIEKELKSNLIGYTKVHDNIFNFNFFVTHSQGLGSNIELRVTYSLNGQSYKIESSNVEPNPNCACRACNPHAWWMVVCSICGNKRCPHASHHDNACTNSNEPGQPGSGF